MVNKKKEVLFFHLLLLIKIMLSSVPGTAMFIA